MYDTLLPKPPVCLSECLCLAPVYSTQTLSLSLSLCLSSALRSEQRPVRYRRAISYDSKEYYMRLLSGNPGMYQHSVEHSTEGETTPHEPEHGEDTIARVKGRGGWVSG